MDRQSVFFTAVNSMDDDHSVEEARCNLDEPRMVPHMSTWRRYQITAYWCNFKLVQKRGLQHDHTQSPSTTHCLRFVLRKQHAWRLEKSYTSKNASLQDSLALYWTRIREVDSRINLVKNQEISQTTKAHPAVAAKIEATTSTIRYETYFNLPSNNRTWIAEKRFKKLIQQFQFENHPMTCTLFPLHTGREALATSWKSNLLTGAGMSKS